jgi:hypothetical protein
VKRIDPVGKGLRFDIHTYDGGVDLLEDIQKGAPNFAKAYNKGL